MFRKNFLSPEPSSKSFIFTDRINVEEEEYLQDWEDQDLVPYKSSLMKKLNTFLQH